MNILIYGTGQAAHGFINGMLNLEKVNILAFVDRTIEDNKKYIGAYKVILREEIQNYNYDYIIIASTFSSIYTTLVDEFNISEYKIVPAFFSGKHPLLEKVILSEIVIKKYNHILIEAIISKNEKYQLIENLCLEGNYIRDKTLVKILEQKLRTNELNEVYLIGKPNVQLANMIITFIEKPIYILHSIEESFQMGMCNEEQKANLKIWEELLENEMKFSRKTVLEQIDNYDLVHYKFGFYPELFDQKIENISLVYIEVAEVNSFKSIFNYIFNYINSGGYIFLYNPNLTQEETISNYEILEYMSNYKELLQLPLIGDQFGMIWYKN